MTTSRYAAVIAAARRPARFIGAWAGVDKVFVPWLGSVERLAAEAGEVIEIRPRGLKILGEGVEDLL